MPGFLSNYNTVTRLEIDPEGKWWVDVRESMTRKDAALAQSALVKPIVKYEGGDSQTQGNIDTVGYQTELVVAAVVNWNLTDEDDVLLPLDPPEAKRESINRLPDKVFMLIAGHTQGVKKPGAPEDAAFQAGSVGRAKVRVAPTP